MQEERGVSIGEIFKVIFKKIWWVLGVTAAFVIIFVLLVQFVYNKFQQTYSIGFRLEYPDSDSGLYPDGTNFRIADFVTADTLNKLKQGDERFASVDVDKMVAEDDISIDVRNYSEITDDNYFVITVNRRYFSDKNQAAEFIRAIAENPVVTINNQVTQSEYSSNLTAFYAARTYEEQIQYLQAQLNYIDEMYMDLIDLYGQYYTVNGKSLGLYKLELDSILDSTAIDLLKQELSVRYYVKDTERFLANYQFEKEALAIEEEQNNLKIEALREERDKVLTDSAVETFNAEIVELVKRNSQIAIALDTIDNKLQAINSTDKSAQQAFEAKLSGYAEQLEEATARFKDVRIAVYEEKSSVTFMTNKISAEGGMNVVLAAVLGAVIGFIVVSIVICIIDLPKYVKKRDGELKDKPEEA